MTRAITVFMCAGLSVALAAARQPAPAGTPQSVWGTVRDQSGAAVEGALVSIRAVTQTFTTSVYTDEGGEYVTPPLPAGRYAMWAQATGFGTARAEVTLGKPVSQPFTLKPLDDFGPQLTGTEWFDSLPAPSREDQRAKQALRVVCSDCHSLAVVLQNRFDEAGWKTIITAMGDSAHNGWKGRDAAKAPIGPFSIFKRTVIYHRQMIAAYLAKVRGPNSPPLTYTRQPRPRGEAARVVITDFDVPIGERDNELAWYDGSDWQEGPAVGMHGIVGPHDVVADRDGNAWIFESRTSFETHRTAVKLDTRTGRMTSIAALANGSVLSTEQLAIDQKGDIWSGLIGGGGMRWSPPSGTMTVFAAPKGYPGFVNSIDPDSQGRIWYNTFGGVARLDPRTKEWVQFKSPTPYDGFSYGMAADAKDNAFWSLWNGDTVDHVDMKTGKITEISMRDPEYDARKALATPEDLKAYDEMGSLKPTGNGGLTAHPIPYQAAPRRMAADKKGRSVFVPNWASGYIAEIDIDTLKPTFIKLPMSGQPYKVGVDAQQRMWTVNPMGDVLLRLEPKSKKWTIFPFATHGCGPRHMSVDHYTGNVWVPCDQASKVSRFQFRTAQQVQSQKAAAKAVR